MPVRVHVQPRRGQLNPPSRRDPLRRAWEARARRPYAGPATPGLPAAILVRPDGYVAWASDDRTDLAAQAKAAVARGFSAEPVSRA
ncbi:aromatic-ring hydroxylase C-terminal domain-containing protein [Nonomuraea sp. NBC_00507]|uniref:aromatic-ring hydroxylase C-terminal domain-containing protein n=1 Tax=Nonomuraea sp. NBC_00507 TaxID=2976002 RepID=UPI003FA603A0